MSTQITLPSLGENIASGDVLSILVKAGDVVKKDQDLLEVETDKATLPIPSPSAGKILKILVAEGQTVPVGGALFELEAAAAAAVAPAAPTPTPPAARELAPPPAPTPPSAAKTQAVTTVAPVAAVPVAPVVVAPVAVVDTPGDGHASAAAGPAVRRLARELGVDLRRVRPSGSAGRITEDDVRAHVRHANEQANHSASPSVTPPGTPQSDSQGAVRIEKMSRMRQTIANNMVLSYTTIPQLTNFDDADVTELEDMRTQSKEDYAKRGLKLTQLPFLIKALASSLKLHPIVNASVDMAAGQIIYKEYVNIGVAVDTDRGLTVPVIRDADRLGIAQIAREIDRLATKAREGSLAVDDMRGGTFTISNLGAVGGVYSTPIINPPEVAILLVGRSRTMPVYVEEELEPRLLMPLSLTYDHRIVDGAAAARFLNEVKGFLAAPGRLLLAP